MTDEQVAYILAAIAEPKKTAVVCCCTAPSLDRWRRIISDTLVDQRILLRCSVGMIEAKNLSRVILVHDDLEADRGHENWRRGLRFDALVYD